MIACFALWVVALAGRADGPVIEARANPFWNAKFNTKSGWIGGDEAYSALLAPNRALWLFGDSLIGKVKNRRREGAVMVNNAVAIQRAPFEVSKPRFFTGKDKDGKPAGFFLPADGKGWLWPRAAVRIGKQLFVFLIQVVHTDTPGPFGFKHRALWLAVIDNPDDEPPEWRIHQRRVPFAELKATTERCLGSAVLKDGQFVYVYGYADHGFKFGKRRLLVARVPATKFADFSCWRFRTASGWSADAAQCNEFPQGLASEFSVTKLSDRLYLLVYTENGLGAKILGRLAPSPVGPWASPRVLYTCPEMDRDRGVFCYAAKAHPWAVSGNQLLMSYCVNAWKFGRLFSDESIYRPKFLAITFRLLKQEGGRASGPSRPSSR